MIILSQFFYFYCVIILFCGEMAEWLKAHAWKACKWRKLLRGFESLSLRHIYIQFNIRHGRASEWGHGGSMFPGFEKTDRVYTRESAALKRTK